jgi:hypothetical protein
VAGAAKPAAGHGSSGGGWLLPLALILLAVPAWAGINLGIRRLRWQVRRRRGGSRGDAGQVLSMWSEVLEMLAWRGLAQDRNESDDEYAVRTAERLGARRGDLYPGVAGRVTQLAGLVQQAAFAARMGPDGPPAAQAAAAEIRRGLIRSASRRQLITWVFWPSGAGRRRPVGYG